VRRTVESCQKLKLRGKELERRVTEALPMAAVKRKGQAVTLRWTIKHYILLAKWPKDLFKLMIEILKLAEQRSAEEAIESRGGKKKSSGRKKTEKLPSGYSFFIKFSGKLFYDAFTSFRPEYF